MLPMRLSVRRSVLSFAAFASFAAIGCSSSTTTQTPVGDAGSASPSDPTPEELLSGGACEAPTGPGTDHTGTITSDETWTAAGSPHRIPSALQLKATLTIEPCAVVQLSPGVSVDVGTATEAGRLVTKGTSALVDGKKVVRPVRFGAAEAGQSWGKLEVQAKGTVDLVVTALANGGRITVNQPGALVVVGVAGGASDGEVTKSAKLDRVLIEKSESYGVNLEAWGAFADGSAKVWIRNGGSANYPFPIRLEPGVATTLPKELVVSGNVTDELLLLSTKAFMRDDTLVSRGIPYRQRGVLRVNGSADGAPVKLVIEPGVTLAFEKDVGSGMVIGSSKDRLGILEAIGTAAAPIVFTSARPQKAPGDWMSLSFRAIPKTGCRLSYARVEYAGDDSSANSFGCGPKDNDGAVFVQGIGPDESGPSTPFIDHTTFDNIAGTTVIVSGWIDDAGPNLAEGNTFGPATPSCKVSRPRRSGAGDVCDGGRDQCWP